MNTVEILLFLSDYPFALSALGNIPTWLTEDTLVTYKDDTFTLHALDSLMRPVSYIVQDLEHLKALVFNPE